MATEDGGWDTSTALIRRVFRTCIEKGRRAQGQNGPEVGFGGLTMTIDLTFGSFSKPTVSLARAFTLSRIFWPTQTGSRLGCVRWDIKTCFVMSETAVRHSLTSLLDAESSFISTSRRRFPERQGRSSYHRYIRWCRFLVSEYIVHDQHASHSYPDTP